MPQKDHTDSNRSDVATLVKLISAHAPYDGRFELRVPGVYAIRMSHRSDVPLAARVGPAVCITAQGEKRVLLGDDVLDNTPSTVTLYCVEVPIAAEVTRATPAEPFLNLRIDLDPKTVSKLAAKVYRFGFRAPFQQVSESSVAQSLVLSQLYMRGGKFVDKLAFTYTSDAGLESYAQGGNGGSLSPTLLLQSGERLTAISGRIGDLVNQLTLTTSFRNTLTWPPSPEFTPDTFSWTPATTSTFFLGFTGRSGQYLDSISIITATFSAARWVVRPMPS